MAGLAAGPLRPGLTAVDAVAATTAVAPAEVPEVPPAPERRAAEERPPRPTSWGPDLWVLPVEPPKGIEPLTYSLRVNRSGRLS
jgi:hypothetical protein